jgi:exodeoxyribonuclease VII large subunit
LENLQKRLDNKMKQKLDFEVNRYVGLKNRLEAGSPLSILHRGYSLIFDEHNNSIHSVDEIEQQDVLTIHLNDGKAKAVVTEKEKDDGGQKT